MTVYTIYGRPKVGKTTMALKDAPKGKTGIISADQGLIGIDTTGFNVEEDMSAKNLTKLMNGPFLRSHTRILLDTATALHADMLFEMTRGGGASQSQYGVANSALLALVRQLRNEKAKQSIVIAQEKLILPNEDWMSEDDDEDTGVTVSYTHLTLPTTSRV